jgi:hypothetical protein
MMAQNPRTTSFVPFVGRDARPDRSAMETALANGFCIIRWTVEQAGT